MYLHLHFFKTYLYLRMDRAIDIRTCKNILKAKATLCSNKHQNVPYCSPFFFCCNQIIGRKYPSQFAVIKNMLPFIYLRLNSSFRLLTFTKLRFWSSKKTTEPPPKFCKCSSFGPSKTKKIYKKITCGTSLRVLRQR